MKKLLVTMAIFSLVACASQTPYTQATGENDYGYQENRITDNRYRVSFRGNTATSSDEVKDMALLRAAELTLVNDYDWFRVVSQQTDALHNGATAVDNAVVAPPSTYRSCGALGCTTTLVPGQSTVIVDDDGSNFYFTSIEIVMGEGPVEDDTTVYDASEIRTGLRDRY
jgi:flavin-binding protein dodecin